MTPQSTPLGNSVPPRRSSLLERILFPRLSIPPATLRRHVAGKTILVTGASRGIGEALALRLAEGGAHLILVARSEDALRSVQERIANMGGSAEIHALDLRDENALASFLDFLGDRHLDVFVNNAGKSIRRPLADSLDRSHDFDRTMALNYHAPVRLLLRLVPRLRERRGQIVNVSALNLLMNPMPYWAAYQASKSAFDQWLRCAEPELRAWSIATSTLYLPLVRTAMIAPTHAYRDMPAMDPDQAALRIVGCIVRRSRRWIPWWGLALEAGSLILRPLIERVQFRAIRKASRAPGI